MDDGQLTIFADNVKISDSWLKNNKKISEIANRLSSIPGAQCSI